MKFHVVVIVISALAAVSAANPTWGMGHYGGSRRGGWRHHGYGMGSFEQDSSRERGWRPHGYGMGPFGLGRNRGGWRHHGYGMNWLPQDVSRGGWRHHGYGINLFNQDADRREGWRHGFGMNPFEQTRRIFFHHLGGLCNENRMHHRLIRCSYPDLQVFVDINNIIISKNTYDNALKQFSEPQQQNITQVMVCIGERGGWNPVEPQLTLFGLRMSMNVATANCIEEHAATCKEEENMIATWLICVQRKCVEQNIASDDDSRDNDQQDINDDDSKEDDQQDTSDYDNREYDQQDMNDDNNQEDDQVTDEYGNREDDQQDTNYYDNREDDQQDMNDDDSREDDQQDESDINVENIPFYENNEVELI